MLVKKPFYKKSFNTIAVKQVIGLILITIVFHACGEVEVKKSESITSDSEFTTETKSSDTREIWQKPEMVMDIMGDMKGKSIADIGAGTGYFTMKLLNKAEKVIGIDIDQDMIDLMNNVVETYPDTIQNRFEARLALSDDPKLADSEVDNILIVNTIAYIDNRVEYLSRLKKALKQNGELYIIDYKVKRLPIDAPEYSDRVYMHVIEEQLDSAGFQNITIDDTSLDFQYIVKAMP